MRWRDEARAKRQVYAQSAANRKIKEVPVPQALLATKRRTKLSENNEIRRRPPPVPQGIIDQIKRRPRAVLEAERHVNKMVDSAVVDSMLDLAAILQERMACAVGLIDAGQVPEARALLDASVLALDDLDIRPMERR